MNNLLNKLIKLVDGRFLIYFSLIFSSTLFSQNKNYNSSKKYTIENIIVSGTNNYSKSTIIAYSGINKGDILEVPGEKISAAIKKLWESDLFSSIEFYVVNINGNKADIEIALQDLPEIKNITIKGLKKKKAEALKDENKIREGIKLTENLLTTTKNYLTNKYKKEGYFNAVVDIETSETYTDSLSSNTKVDLKIDIKKGKKLKVEYIKFQNSNKLSEKLLKGSMKNTKQKNAFRFFKRSKYIEKDYKEDLTSVITKYKEKGYRDARVISDSVYLTPRNKVAIDLTIEEGEQYKFGNISFIGNTVYNSQQLNQILRIRKGSIYNAVQLEERIADNTSPDANDLTNLYQNNGYLFSTINPVEVSAEGNVIDVEVRISEGKPAHFNKISVNGNDTTNDKIIYRELHTKPGELYSKQDVIRSIRELSQLGFFDAQQITPDFKNMNPEEGLVDIEYSVVEKGSSQIQLQGGFGGGGFIGTLGLSFNNFSIRNILNAEAYKPVPRGDGQSLGINLQASRFFRTASFSFMEPWLNGKRPLQFSTSLSHTQQFLYNPVSRDADKNKRFDITGITVGLGKRLRKPDDFFMLSQTVGYQHFNLKNYNTGLFTFGDGESNNLYYQIGLSRSDTYNDPIYPIGGSSYSVSAKLTIPYSIFNDTDYEALKDEYDSLDRNNPDEYQRMGEIDQERYKWLEFYKIKFKADNYTALIGKLVLKSTFEFGFLGAYNNDRGIIPFERFFLGGDGLANYSLDGREVIQLRGYPNQSLSNQDGGSIYNKYSLELRYPITLGEQAKIYGLTFFEAGSSYNDFKDYTPFELNRSAGFGLRLFMPMFGLLGFDFGYGMDPLPYSGFKQPNGWETHFIIGQQF